MLWVQVCADDLAGGLEFSEAPGDPIMSASSPLLLEPLDGPFGRAVFGVDVRAGLTDTQLRTLSQALYEHRVIVLKDQGCNEKELVAFARRWGEPIAHLFDDDRWSDYPELLQMGNMGKHQRDELARNSSAYWHTDNAYEADMAAATMLYAIKTPDSGGETRFADQKAAYDTLDDATKGRIDALTAMHYYAATAGRDGECACVPMDEAQAARFPPVSHPLVRAHSVTGAKALYAVAGTAYAIEGLSDQDGQSLIAELKAHATRERFVYEHKYEVGDIAVWDNQMTLHCAKPIGPPTGPNTERLLWRVSVRGKPEIYR